MKRYRAAADRWITRQELAVALSPKRVSSEARKRWVTLCWVWAALWALAGFIFLPAFALAVISFLMTFLPIGMSRESGA